MKPEEDRSKKRKRGVASRWSGSLLCIEGETLTIQEIASRLGLPYQATHYRLAKARKAEGPVTWAKLGFVAE